MLYEASERCVSSKESVIETVTRFNRTKTLELNSVVGWRENKTTRNDVIIRRMTTGQPNNKFQSNRVLK